MQIQNQSALSATLEGKCPRCRVGKMFEAPVYHLSKSLSMHTFCPCCNLRYEIEPGFFYGAMYVSYAFSVAIVLITGFVLYFVFNDPALWVYITSVIVFSAITYPFNFRVSRILFLHVFGGVKYDPSKGCD